MRGKSVNGLTAKQSMQKTNISNRHVAMRILRAKSDTLLAAARQLSPPGGTIPIGGAHFDPFVKGEAIAVFLRHLGDGDPVKTAAKAASDYARCAIIEWNRNHDWQTQRYIKMADSVIDDAEKAINEADEA